jgi:hypothetical protein
LRPISGYGQRRFEVDILVDDLVRVMVFVLGHQARFADQDISLLCVGAFEATPGDHRFAPLSLTRLAVSIARLILSYDPWIRHSHLRGDDLLQGEPMLDLVLTALYLSPDLPTAAYDMRQGSHGAHGLAHV